MEYNPGNENCQQNIIEKCRSFIKECENRKIQCISDESFSKDIILYNINSNINPMECLFMVLSLYKYFEAMTFLIEKYPILIYINPRKRLDDTCIGRTIMYCYDSKVWEFLCKYVSSGQLINLIGYHIDSKRISNELIEWLFTKNITKKQYQLLFLKACSFDFFFSIAKKIYDKISYVVSDITMRKALTVGVKIKRKDNILNWLIYDIGVFSIIKKNIENPEFLLSKREKKELAEFIVEKFHLPKFLLIFGFLFGGINSLFVNRLPIYCFLDTIDFL